MTIENPSKSGDDETITKLLDIVADLIQGKRHSRHTIKEATNKSLTTADRWIERLESQLGAKRKREGRTVWLSLDVAAQAPTRSAVLGACAATSLAALFAGTAHERNLRDARDWMMKQRGEAFVDLDRKFVFAPRGGEYALPDGEANLDEIFEAVLKSRVLRFDYRHNAGNKESLTVEPLSLLIFDHQFYVLCRRPDGSFYCYRFSRISSADATSRTFAYPPRIEYDPREVLEPGFGVHISGTGPVEDVEILLKGDWASFATNHRWHPSQSAKRNEDETVTVRLRVRHCREVETWVLGFGEYAKVLHPDGLRDKIAARLRQGAARYQGRVPTRPPIAKAGAAAGSDARRARKGGGGRT